MTVKKRHSIVSLAFGRAGASLALTIAALLPASANASFAHFSGGVLTVHSSEGKVVPRCASDGELTVSGAFPDEGGNCRDLRRIDATAFTSAIFDFSQLPADLGGGQGPIEIHATSSVTDEFEISDDKFIGAPGHLNIFNGGLGFDSLTGGDLNDTLSGGADSDKIDGMGGKDTVRGGADGDKLIGGLGADSLFGGAGGDKLLGGPGRDILKGGGGTDKLVGGPGKDTEQQ